ncbi:MAG: DNA polymerase III subunit gamma/tau [Anaerolineales bacterium]|nr:MAG: DNA polymerase III subunit gamma/tau [Anaerolineales bacterium]
MSAPTLSLYRKYRPNNWPDVVGQAHVVSTLRNAVAADRVGHAYLFSGPRGTGKTSIARLLAKAINCTNEDATQRPDCTCENCLSMQNGSFMDLIEIDAASNTSVEDVRELRDKINFSPNRGKFKVYIIDEVHMLSTAAFNALLKTLEEPPPHAIFILATTEMHKIPATVLSRCQRHEFRRLPLEETVAQLEKIAKDEGVEADRDALELIARQGTGSLRDSISLFDQLAVPGERLQLGWAQQVLGTSASEAVLGVLDALVAKDAAAGLEQIRAALDTGSDARQLARQLVDTLRGLLLIRMGAPLGHEFAGDEARRMKAQAEALTPASILRMLRLFNEAAAEVRQAWQPGLPLEMALVEAMQTPGDAASQSEAPAPRSQPAPQRQTSAPRPSAPPASATAGGQGLDLAQWNKVKDLAKQQNANLAALLNSVKARQLREDKLLLGFSTDVLKDKMEKPDTMELLRNVLQQAFGRPLDVQCFLSTASASDLPAGLDSSGAVATAVRLGGEIVDQTDQATSD